ncbi:chaperonin 10-like protein [Pisolithus croceorrhizus]|nr:chaperonin 10-like protein [Pisolithus croceorrhizus]KAI6125670.1 chaperonin 10-like protein [Pisolithus croceorrhizus]
MQLQKALFLESKKGQFVVRQREIPAPGSGQLLVKIYATALNNIDWKIQQSGSHVDVYPAILGSDIAGEVVEVGHGDTGFTKGQKVFACGNRVNDQAGFQQYTLTTSIFTAGIPAGLTYDQAATLPLTLNTAAVGLYSNTFGAGLLPPWTEFGKDKYSGKPILVSGASSSVGSYVIQFARCSGFSPIIAIASETHEGNLKSLGATHVVNRRLSSEEQKKVITSITTAPIDIAYDAVAFPETQRVAFDVLAPNGTLVVTVQPAVKEDQGKGRKVVVARGTPHAPPNKTLCQGLWGVLEQWLADEIIKPGPFEVLPDGLHGIPEGLRRMREDGAGGVKLVAHPQQE